MAPVLDFGVVDSRSHDVVPSHVRDVSKLGRPSVVWDDVTEEDVVSVDLVRDDVVEEEEEEDVEEERTWSNKWVLAFLPLLEISRE